MSKCVTKADFFYDNFLGRAVLKLIQKTGGFRIAAWFLHTKMSRKLIPGYIRKNGIDMKPFEGQSYASFADFFARSKAVSHYVLDPDVLISPCDGWLTTYPVTDALNIPMKGSQYRLEDLIPDKETAERFRGGICLVFRLEASDYHHFCCFDDLLKYETQFVPGLLHSVQPIACERVPVYRLNRRWWSLMETAHFGYAAQIAVGAMLVGGVRFAKEVGFFSRGEEMGNFELAGSTIVLLLDASARRRIQLLEPYQKTWNGMEEIQVRMGEGIGRVAP